MEKVAIKIKPEYWSLFVKINKNDQNHFKSEFKSVFFSIFTSPENICYKKHNSRLQLIIQFIYKLHKFIAASINSSTLRFNSKTHAGTVYQNS